MNISYFVEIIKLKVNIILRSIKCSEATIRLIFISSYEFPSMNRI
jgi:hypothetical protein